MDQATLSALIKSYGAKDIPENTNRIREFYASDPKAAENRLYGARAPSDESGGSRDMVLNAILDKVIAQTAAPSQAIQQEPLAPLPMVQNASAPTKRSATAGGRNAVPVSPPEMQPGWQDNTEITSPTIGAPSGGGGVMDWLLPLILGVGSMSPLARGPGQPNANANARGAGAGGEGSANRRLTGPDPNAKQLTYQPKLENNAPNTTRNSPELEAKGKAAADNYAKLQSEVEADNAALLQRQMMEQTAREAEMRKMRAQGSTRNTLKAAGRLFGRK